MPLYTPKRDWEGKAAFLIGGGSSLAQFDFNFLIGKNTIGINEAFHLGPAVVNTCLFGDASFFHKNVHQLEKFPNRVVTCSPNLLNMRLAWLLQMKRIRDGLYFGDTLGWNHSTGAAAINLAISLGAAKIYLLGYDAGRIDNKTHWHKYRTKYIPDESYVRFIKGFRNLHAELPRVPQVKVLNVTDGSSHLPLFDRMDPHTFLQQAKNE